MDEKRVPTILRKKLPPFLEEIKNTPHTPKDKNYSIHKYLQENDLRVKEEGSEIVDFLRGKNVLVTGGTGFLGKMLVEKLLRSCKDIGTVYLIIRTKKGVNPQNRVKDLLDNFVFYKLAEIFPNFREKVVGISGDFEEDGIGLSEEAKQIIRTKVNLIYHIAATVRFDERLTKAVNINLRGTLQMIKLAHECKKLVSFTYMSTAFSNCNRKHIDEVFYPPYMDPYQLMNLVGELPEEIVDKITPQLLGEMPNTYAFTKQIAEDVVRRESAGLPLCIQRPSIVIASVREPIRSWIDNVFGPVGVMQAAASGILHVNYGGRNVRCDLVPADYTINHCIACSYAIAMKNKSGREIQNEIPIYNFTSSDDNPTKWMDLEKSKIQGYKMGTTKAVIYPFARLTSCLYWYLILRFWFHTIPAYIMDYGLILKGEKPIFRNAYNKMNKFIDILSYFTLNSWTFGYQHTTKLWKDLNEVDKKNFNFDMKSLNWDKYFHTYYVALREILLKEPLDNLLEGQKHVQKITIFFYIITTLVLGLSVYFLLNTIFFFIPLLFISFVIFYWLTDVSE